MPALWPYYNVFLRLWILHLSPQQYLVFDVARSFLLAERSGILPSNHPGVRWVKIKLTHVRHVRCGGRPGDDVLPQIHKPDRGRSLGMGLHDSFHSMHSLWHQLPGGCLKNRCPHSVAPKCALQLVVSKCPGPKNQAVSKTMAMAINEG